MKDINIPIECVRELAEQGDAKAQFNLGTFYELGKGVKQDTNEAVQWWQKAAEQGYADSFEALEELIKKGLIENLF